MDANADKCFPYVSDPNDSRFFAWPQAYAPGSDEQEVVETSLARFASREYYPPPKRDVDDRPGDESWELAQLRLGDGLNEEESPYLSGLPRAVEVHAVLRILHGQRPAPGEVVRYIKGLGARLVWRAKTGQLLRAEPGLIESFWCGGEFFACNPTWLGRPIRGRHVIDCATTFAAELPSRGVEIDAEELEALLASGLRTALITEAAADTWSQGGAA